MFMFGEYCQIIFYYVIVKNALRSCVNDKGQVNYNMGTQKINMLLHDIFVQKSCTW